MSTVVDAKVVLLGASSVGKTCIVTRAVSDFFDPEQISTVGASFSIKTVIVGNTTMNLRIWDTAGQERFKSLAPMYYHTLQKRLYYILSEISSIYLNHAKYQLKKHKRKLLI